MMVPNSTGGHICLCVGDTSSAVRMHSLLRVFEDCTYEIVNSSATCTVMPPLEMEWQVYIPNPPIELPEVKYYRVGQRGDIISRSGKIVSLWNSWRSKWMVWYAPRQIEPVRIITDKFIRRFRGNNRGRHFDRKLR